MSIDAFHFDLLSFFLGGAAGVIGTLALAWTMLAAIFRESDRDEAREVASMDTDSAIKEVRP